MAVCSFRSGPGSAVVLQQNGLTITVKTGTEHLPGAEPVQAADAAQQQQLLRQGLLVLAQHLAADVTAGSDASSTEAEDHDAGQPGDPLVWITKSNWSKKPPAARYHVHIGCQPAAAIRMIPKKLSAVKLAGIRECQHCIPDSRRAWLGPVRDVQAHVAANAPVVRG